jgi:glycine cleavage system H protein
LSDYDLPDSNRYSKDDEWVREEKDGRVAVGITDYAQQQLGDVVYVELPEVGATYKAGQPFGVIESVKAVSDLYSPITGEVLEVNGELEDAPEKVNEECYGSGWLVAFRPASAAELEGLMDSAAYAAHIAAREE